MADGYDFVGLAIDGAGGLQHEPRHCRRHAVRSQGRAPCRHARHRRCDRRQYRTEPAGGARPGGRRSPGDRRGQSGAQHAAGDGHRGSRAEWRDRCRDRRARHGPARWPVAGVAGDRADHARADAERACGRCCRPRSRAIRASCRRCSRSSSDPSTTGRSWCDRSRHDVSAPVSRNWCSRGSSCCAPARASSATRRAPSTCPRRNASRSPVSLPIWAEIANSPSSFRTITTMSIARAERGVCAADGEDAGGGALAPHSGGNLRRRSPRCYARGARSPYPRRARPRLRVRVCRRPRIFRLFATSCSRSRRTPGPEARCAPRSRSIRSCCGNGKRSRRNIRPPDSRSIGNS